MISRAAHSAVLLASALLLALPPAAPAAAGDVTDYPLPAANSNPADIVAGGDGNLWVSETKGHALARLTPGGVLDEFRLATDFTAPERVALAQDGNVWFGDQRDQPNRIGRIDPLGLISFSSVPTKSASVGGIEAAPNGNLWITESIGKVGQLAPGGTPPAITEGTAPSNLLDLAAGVDGNMWATDFLGSGAIYRIAMNGTATPFTTGLTPSSSPWQIAAGHDGNLWFTEESGNRIGRITPTGTITEFPLPGGDTGPWGIAPGPDGNVWFTTAQGVGRITPDGTITRFPVSGRPLGIAPGPDGYVWVTANGGNKIVRVATGVARPTSGNLLLNPGFEQGTPVASNFVSGPTPGWTTVPSFSPAAYGATGLADAAVGTQVGGGKGVGWGGTMSANIATSRALQHVDVGREATGIDDGRASVTVSGLLGGLGTQEDNARVDALFLSATGAELGTVRIGPVTAADRNNKTTLLPRSASAALPPGTRAIRVVATATRVNGGPTNDGLFDNLSLTMDVAPAPPAPSGPAGPAGPVAPADSGPSAPGPAADTTSPTISTFSASPARFAVGRGATAVAARKRATPRETTLRYAVSEPATVTLTFERATVGRRSGNRCVKATARNRRARRCTLYVAEGKLNRRAPAGSGSLKFTGRIGRKALAVGAHRITAVAADSAGNKSRGRQVTVRIVKP